MLHESGVAEDDDDRAEEWNSRKKGSDGAIFVRVDKHVDDGEYFWSFVVVVNSEMCVCV